MSCEVCGGTFTAIQSRQEKTEHEVRFVVYMRCTTCGCGRIDYHPFMPKEK